MIFPPAFIDTGSDDGAYAEALLFGSLRPVGPDTFANFTQDPSARHSDSDDLAGPAAHSLTVTIGDISFQIDEPDWHRLKHLPWRTGTSAQGRGFIVRQEGSGRAVKNICIYHDVLGVTPSRAAQVDHINGDPLDNRRANLRLASPTLNVANRAPRKGKVPKYKGVARNSPNRFTARIKDDTGLRKLGSFQTAEEAALAYDRAALSAWGEFAWLNAHHFPELQNLWEQDHV